MIESFFRGVQKRIDSASTPSPTVIAGAVADYLAVNPVTAAWNSITGKPTSFTPSTHTHIASEITTDTNNRFVSDAEKTAYAAKQDALVSGTNIKTINGASVLGSGNIEIQGGSVPVSWGKYF